MLENTPIWMKGDMHLWVNNEPAHVYVPESNIPLTYKKLQSRLSKEGSIPIGIDHLPDNIIEANPILKKLDLLNIGEITQISHANDSIIIEEATITNPLLQQLYNDGELDMVSIVATSTTSECPKGDYDYIVDTTDITRVDIVEKGACTECNIPKPTDSSDTVVYARYSIKENQEENNMAEEITMEAIEKLLDEKIAPINERLDVIEENIDIESNEGNEETEEVKAMKAKIAKQQQELANTKVDAYITNGKILPAEKEAMVKLCAADSESFDNLMKVTPVKIDLKTRKSLLAGDSEDDDDDTLTDDEKLINTLNDAFNKGDD